MASIREEITSKIRDELVAGNFEVGHPLRETEMAKRFGVSRGPIRDAFLQLSKDGFLAYQSNRGVTVRHPPAAEDRGFIASIRSQIELYIVGKGFETLTPISLGRIEITLEELQEACISADVVEVAKADMAFHQAILQECGGEDHIQVWRQLCSRTLLTYSRLDSYQEAYCEHVDIFEALRARDRAKALAAIENNITSPPSRPHSARADQTTEDPPTSDQPGADQLGANQPSADQQIEDPQN